MDEIYDRMSAAAGVRDVGALNALARELESSDDAHVLATAVSVRGLVASLEERSDAAIALYQEALETYTELDDLRDQARMYRNLGLEYTAIADFKAAVMHLSKANAMYQDLGVETGVIATLIDLGNLHFYSSYIDQAIEHWHRALEICERNNDESSRARLQLSLGNAMTERGDYAQALELYSKALFYHVEKEKNLEVQALAYNNMGIVYYYSGVYPDALEHWHRARELYEQLGDQGSIVNLQTNMANLHASNEEYEQGISLFLSSIEANERMNRPRQLAMTLVNLAGSYTAIERHADALDALDRSIRISEEIGDHTMRTGALIARMDLLIKEGRLSEARSILESPEVAGNDNLKNRLKIDTSRATLLKAEGKIEEARSAALELLEFTRGEKYRLEEQGALYILRELARMSGDFEAFIEYNDAYLQIDNEVNGREVTLKMAMLEKQQEMQEIDRQREKERAVLYSTLPKDVADRVVRGEEVTDSFQSASALFLDIVGFTSIAERIPPGHVVYLLKAIFAECDAACASYGLTRVKTIGDSYFAVCGVPTPLDDHAVRAANAALDMMQRLTGLELTMDPSIGDTSWTRDISEITVRIGLSSGPVVAGVVGDTRLQYDVWGDTVNTASRMESTSEPGRIQVSTEFHEQLSTSTPSHYRTVERGTLEVKGKGLMQTYWLESTGSE